MPALLGRYFTRLERGQPWRWRGRVVESVGQTIESAGPLASVGECCEIRDRSGRLHLAEVIGFRGSNVLSMPVETTEGIRYGDEVAGLGIGSEIEVGPALMGRVLNALGRPIDDGPALAATTVAEHFAAQGKHVLLVLDSLTRYAMAAREIGLAAGEPPTAKGYTPSVFTRLARLVERTGQFRCGSITAFYTVLMEGDDQQDPVVDAVRSLLDGHIVLSRALAGEGWYPPIEVLDSISRLMPAVTKGAHREQAALLRRLMAVYARSEDLVRIGAYKPGADPDLDRALGAREALRAFLTQGAQEHVRFDDCVERVAVLAAEV